MAGCSLWSCSAGADGVLGQAYVAKQAISTARVIWEAGALRVASIRVDIRGGIGGDIRTPAGVALQNGERVIAEAELLAKPIRLVYAVIFSLLLALEGTVYEATGTYWHSCLPC